LALTSKPVILIRERNPENKKIFDVDGYYIHPYDPLNYTDLERHIIEKLKRFESGEEQFESPVKRVLQNELTLSQSALSELSIGQQKAILTRGTKLVFANVASAFGPQGTGVPIKNAEGQSILAKQGYAIAKATWSSNPLENKAIELLTQVSENMLANVGDGSKAGILLTCGLIEAGTEALKKGLLPKDVSAGMQKAVSQVPGKGHPVKRIPETFFSQT
jgi:TCP-1/cpn60 chaperonin family